MKVMIGAFAHESNDFCPHLTTREMFEFYEGEEVARHLPVADLFEEAGIEVIPSIYATAESYGPVEEETFLHFERMILDTVRANPDLDGIWMFCHGAMNVQNIGSGEYRLARDLRALVGENCVISFGMDLHGNLEEDFVNQVNIFRCYHTAPHTDQPDTYRRTARALVEYLRHGYRLSHRVAEIQAGEPLNSGWPVVALRHQGDRWLLLLTAEAAPLPEPERFLRCYDLYEKWIPAR